MTDASPPDLLELEIDAFMGPQIKRARIALVLIGVLYAFTGFTSYDEIDRLRDSLAQYTGRHSAEFDRLQSQVSNVYAFVVLTIVVGLANLGLAMIGGKKTTLAMYVAMALFAVHSLFELVLSQGVLVTSVLWWLTAITLGLGFEAALKAERLRRSAAAARA
jgi:lipopolysaccharide export LptBFGC system permease protein LptF